jgi:Xaa-Pro aminopeptidase
MQATGIPAAELAERRERLLAHARGHGCTGAEGLGGFRHSDTVVVTEDGIEILTTDHPRDLESVTIG